VAHDVLCVYIMISLYIALKCYFVYRFSKQAFLSDVQNPHLLPDKSPSFKDFMGNKNNRFINPTMASKNRIQPPSKVITVIKVQWNPLFTLGED
jgi:hypothetical protein